MPLQFMLTADATSRIYRYANREDSGARDLLGTPAGHIIGSMNAVRPVRDVIFKHCAQEFAVAAQRVAGDHLRTRGRLSLRSAPVKVVACQLHRPERARTHPLQVCSGALNLTHWELRSCSVARQADSGTGQITRNSWKET